MEYVAVLAWLSIDGNAVVCAVKLLMFTSRWCNILIINSNVSIKGAGIPTLIMCILCLISLHPVQDFILRCDNVKVVPVHIIQQHQGVKLLQLHSILTRALNGRYIVSCMPQPCYDMRTIPSWVSSRAILYFLEKRHTGSYLELNYNPFLVCS